MTHDLKVDVQRVVDRGNCSGCGGCTLLSTRVSLALSPAGYLRPVVDDDHDAVQSPAEARVLSARFKKMCPGVEVRSRGEGSLHTHPVFGKYTAAWKASATDHATRLAGSSGGVLTALSAWLVATGRATAVVAATGSPADPTRTVSTSVTDRTSALLASGSRYAPVSNLTHVPAALAPYAVVGKPCEATALFQYHDAIGTPPSARPVILSFFCAGTPSQRATDSLVRALGVDADEVRGIRYRGNGCPGSFRVIGDSGELAQMSYRESWGGHLGRQLQDRCKFCVDGTGEHADVSVGDYWEIDESGYPSFVESEGTSVVIARSARGRLLVEEASRAGVIETEDVDLDLVAGVQPLQADRRSTLVGRLIGRRLSGHRIPSYRGFGLWKIASADMRANVRAAAGTFLRGAGWKR